MLDADAALPPSTAVGLYRVRDADGPSLLYVGEGVVAARLAAHRRKSRAPADAQGAVFGAAGRLECSWVLEAGWLKHQRCELEGDLIGSHLLALGTVPPAQFIG
jgi:hypothetical protein